MTAQDNLSRIHVIEPHQKVNKRCLPTARWPHNGDLLPGFHIQLQMLQQRYILSIRKRDILQLQAAVRLPHNYGVPGIRDLGRLLDKIKDPFCTCKCILQLRHHAGNLIKGLCILVRITQETGQLSNGNHPAYRRECAHNPDSRIYKPVYKPRTGIGNGREEYGFQAYFLQPAVDLIKTFQRTVPVTKGLDDLLVSHHFIHQGSHLRPRFRLCPEHGVRSFCYKAGYKKRQRRDQNDH